MVAILRLMAVSMALVLPGVALAQDQATEQEQPAADGNDAGAGLSMGTVEGEDGELQVGQTYVVSQHGDWALRCVKSQGDKDPCQLYQLLVDGEGNSVAEFSIFNLPNSGRAVAGATAVTPLETLLSEPLRLQVDAGQARRYPYSFCSQVGCFSRLGLTQEELDSFKAGAAATVSIVPAAAPDQPVGLRLSLTGFTAGWNALVEANGE